MNMRNTNRTPFEFRASLDRFSPLKWNQKEIHKHYSDIKNFLDSKGLEDISAILSQPQIPKSELHAEELACWTSQELSHDAIPLTDCSENDRKGYQAYLYDIWERLNRKIMLLESSEIPEERNLAQVVRRAYTIPDTEYIFVEGQTLIFVLWGFVQLEGSEPSDERHGNLFSFTVGKSAPVELIPVQSQVRTVSEHISESSEDSEKKRKGPIGTRSSNLRIPQIVPFVLLGLIALLAIIWWLNDRQQLVLPDQAGVLIPLTDGEIDLGPDSVFYISNSRLNICLLETPSRLDDFIAELNLKWRDEIDKILFYDTLMAFTIVQIKVAPENQSSLKKELAGSMPDFPMLVTFEQLYSQSAIPSDPGFQDIEKWWHLEEIKAPGIWNETRGSDSVIIAVIDGGFDLSHPEFEGKTYKPWNVWPPHKIVKPSGNSNHGTHVAGIAVGRADNRHGTAGVAPDCLLMPIDRSNHQEPVSDTPILKSLEYAIRNHATVVNMSFHSLLGADYISTEDESQRRRLLTSQEFENNEKMWNLMMEAAESFGVLIIQAAGNSDLEIGYDPMGRSSYPIIVSAVDEKGQRAEFSNYGVRSDLSAPGVNIYSSLPDGKFGFMSGTSMAAPIVAGAVALLKSLHPTWERNEIVNYLQKTGIPVPGTTKKIGPIIQLANVASEEICNPPLQEPNNSPTTPAKGQSPAPEPSPRSDFPQQEQLEILQRRLDSLEKRFQDCCNLSYPDTLRIPDNASNWNFLTGQWKSSSPLMKSSTGEEVQLYFDLRNNGEGALAIFEKNGNVCGAPLMLGFTDSGFSIAQVENATCKSGGSYNPYNFTCVTSRSGKAECAAQNQINSRNNIRFNLIRVHSN